MSRRQARRLGRVLEFAEAEKLKRAGKEFQHWLEHGVAKSEEHRHPTLPFGLFPSRSNRVLSDA